jgi:hypothetical protein
MCKRDVVYGLAAFNATMEYSYTLPSMSEDEYVFKGFLDAIGVKFTPRIIWNAIPWSFVVDWVADVGQYLDNFGTRNVEPVLNIHRYCYSAHVKRTVSTYINTQYNSPLGGAGDVPLCTVTEDAYTRKVNALVSTDMYRLVRLSGLDLNKIALGAALFGTRL